MQDKVRAGWVVGDGSPGAANGIAAVDIMNGAEQMPRTVLWPIFDQLVARTQDGSQAICPHLLPSWNLAYVDVPDLSLRCQSCRTHQDRDTCYRCGRNSDVREAVAGIGPTYVSAALCRTCRGGAVG